MNDIYSLLVRLKNIGVTLETNLVHDIVNKLESGLTVDGVYELLDNLKEIGVKLGENTAVCIVNKLKSGLTLDNVSTLLKKFQNINVQLNSNMDGQGKDNVVDAIVGKLQSHQIAEDLLNLVKTLQEFNIQPIANTCKQILSLLGDKKDAGDVADLLINLGNLVGFDKIQDDQNLYLPGIDDILKKIATKQSEENIVKLAEVLIAMGKNLRACQKDFRNKLAGRSDELEKLLNLKSGGVEYRKKQGEFVKEFKQKINLKKSEKGSNGEQKKNEAGDKKAVLKILGGILAILGIICIILSLTIAESVLLGLLIPGCGLLTAGIISILVELFWNNKNDKSPIRLPSGNQQPESFISNPGNNNNIELSINLKTNRDISYDDDEF